MKAKKKCHRKGETGEKIVYFLLSAVCFYSIIPNYSLSSKPNEVHFVDNQAHNQHLQFAILKLFYFVTGQNQPVVM